MTPAVPPALLADRIRRAGDVAAEQDVELLLVTPGTDLRYLLDADGASHERLTCLVLPAAGQRARRRADPDRGGRPDARGARVRAARRAARGHRHPRGPDRQRAADAQG